MNRSLRPCLLIMGLVCLLVVASTPAAQQPPAGQLPTGAAKTPDAELQALLDQVTKLDPRAPDYPARLKAVLQDLIRINQALARENAALRTQLSAGSSTRPPRAGTRPAAGNGGAAAQPLPAGALFGNRNSKKYHKVGCQFGDRTRVTERVPLASTQAAAAAGYQPCRVCRPDAGTAPGKQ